MINILILISLGMVGLLVLLMLGFGIRGLTNRRTSTVAMISTLAPIGLLVVLGLIIGDWAVAGIYAVAITLAATILAMVLSGFRGLFN